MTISSDPAVETVEELEGGFSRRALGWIIGSVAVSLVATVLLVVYGQDLQRQPTPWANSFSDSALGHRAAVAFLNRMGMGVVPNRSMMGGDIGPQRPLVLAEPSPRGPGWDPEHLKDLAVRARDRKAPLVLVLPKWRAGAARKDKPEWLKSVRLLSDFEIVRAAQALDDPDLKNLSLGRHRSAQGCVQSWDSPAGPRVDVQWVQLLERAANLQPLVSCSGGILVARRPATDKGPQVIVVADPDLLNNQGLGRGENALLIYQLFTRGLEAGGAVFDETIHGFTRTPGLLNEALSFPLVLAVLQGLVLLGVVLWAGMGRFGKPLPVSLGLAAGKEILIDNTAKLLANGGDAADGVVRYFRQVTRAVAAHYFLPPDLPDGERIALLQRITDARGIKIRLAQLERSLLELPLGRQGEEQAVRYARRLYDWRVEMTNVH
ncbi:MAG TPA: hypothetical protein VHC97_20560 [Thermoanaerobaculia bacterium]|nr:hypothetical protein [Thermoanaerobaculia bacterium]